MRIVRSTQYRAKSLRKRMFSGVTGALLMGCIALPVMPTAAVAQSLPDDRGQLMFDILIGELAGRRGQLDVATDSYLRAAYRSDDQRVAKRATQLAVWGRRWADAQEIGNRWLTLAPESTEPHELLAQVYLQTNQTEQATTALSRFITLNDDKKTAIDEVVLTLMREADRARALKILSDLSAQHTNQIEIIIAQARMALSMGAREDALEGAQAALELDAQNGSALLLKAQALGSMGKPGEGFDDIRAALEKDNLNIELRLGFAQLLVDAGRHADASEQLEILFQQTGDSQPELLLSMGLLALESKRSDAAIRYLEALLAVDQQNDQAHFYLGRIRDEQQEYAEAIKHYEQVRAENLYFPSQLRSAELHASMGELEVGRERLQALKRVATNKELHPQIITTEARMVKQSGDVGAAIVVLSDGLKRFPDSGELLYARALTAEANNDPDMLRRDLNTLIEVDPENAHAMNALGYHLADNNIELERARDLLERAYALIPDDAAIMDSLGWLRYRQGDSNAALELLQKAYDLLPDPEIAAHLGEVLWTLGDQLAARKLWDKAILDAPDHTKLKQAIERFVQ
jgi:tetratricopeptide (TPR) repeat protein